MNALARFLPILAEKTKPITKLLKKVDTFEWSEQCERAFTQLKSMIAKPPILVRPIPTQPLIVYLATSHEVI